jgi:tRNA dimethylallyltransferase
MNPRIIVILGPTASGKSDLAIVVARCFGGEIISADSRQVYRGMDIGTGKVTKREQKLARHWLIDVASPKRQFTVADFQRLGQKAIADILRRGKIPIICGGTGFYIDALIHNTNLPDVPPDVKLRAQLEKKTTAQLFAQLQRRDPRRADTIDSHNKRRLIRALEIIMTTHKPVPPPVAPQPQFDILWLGIRWPKDNLDKRIAARLDKRLRQGMIREVHKLNESGVSFKRLESFGLEYRWVVRYVHTLPKLSAKEGKISYKNMRDRLLTDIIHYAKRQMTWFKRNKNIRWVANQKQAVEACSEFLA